MDTANAHPVKQRGPRSDWALIIFTILSLALVIIVCLWYEHSTALPPPVVIPTPPMPALNAFNDFNAAANAVRQNRWVDDTINGMPPPGAPMTLIGSYPYTLAQREAALQASAPALRLLRQGLTLPYQSPPIRSPNDSLAYYSGFRDLARTCAFAAQVSAQQGQWDAAVRVSLDAVQEGEKIGHKSEWIGLLVGLACQAIGRKPLWGEVGQLTAPQAEAAARRLEAIQAEEAPLAENCREMKWTEEAEVLAILRKPDWRSQLLNGTGLSSWADLRDHGLTRATTTAASLLMSRRRAFADFQRQLDDATQAAQRPYSAVAVTLTAPGDPLVPDFTDTLQELRVKAADTDAENRLLLVSLALRAYHAAHGAYPASLQALVPAYLPRVPADPFAATSTPLRYRRQGSAYLLYSLGPDDQDNGGTPISQPYVDHKSRGDIVAGINL